MTATSAVPVRWGGRSWEGATTWPDRTSKAYDLAVRLEVGMTQHAAHERYGYRLVQRHGDHNYPKGISAAMEVMSMPGHCGTHVDSLGHISVDGCITGDRDITSLQSEEEGVPIGSVEELPPLVGTGHLVDGEELFGREMTNRDGFGARELEEWFAGRPEPGPGSVVLFRTGLMKYWDTPDRYLGTGVGLPGVSLSGAEWLSSRGVLAVGGDTASFEHKPEWTVPALDVHVHFLVRSAIPIMESVYLEGLASDGVYDGFFFVATPLRIKGGTGSPIRPLAFA
ncbi:cyclase family protein [Saccharopolyspora sp. ASAGF58]|uniref:cyclase family protein n=1 Tax=Saccharopolyspora sp. ASAGF58 TaxID=2719023 RepID=UPI00143FC074|nr:cyclase family protein [Saccharopolyspora sp. ASAGF58]QIZ37729.1 cyclase family protein [Saccharopolyspora sp. ASAGF58]